VGLTVGACETVGACDGEIDTLTGTCPNVGRAVGFAVGLAVGRAVGLDVGVCDVGPGVGFLVGICVGFLVGICVGLIVGFASLTALLSVSMSVHCSRHNKSIRLIARGHSQKVRRASLWIGAALVRRCPCR